MEIPFVEVFKLHFGSKKQVFQEKCLHRGDYSARTSFVLKQSVLQILVEVEPLFPRIVNVTLAILEEQRLNRLAFLHAHWLFVRELLNHLSTVRVHVERVRTLFVDFGTQHLSPLVFLVHEFVY